MHYRLHMGMCASGDIFLARVSNRIGDIEDVKTYIYNILFLRKHSFSKHIEQLRIIFGGFRSPVLNSMLLSAVFFKYIT